MKIDEGLLRIIDGAKGLRKALHDVIENKVWVQRCQWHKRENVLRYLPKGIQRSMRRRLQKAYEEHTYEKAKEKLLKIRKDQPIGCE